MPAVIEGCIYFHMVSVKITVSTCFIETQNETAEFVSEPGSGSRSVLMCDT